MPEPLTKQSLLTDEQLDRWIAELRNPTVKPIRESLMEFDFYADGECTPCGACALGAFAIANPDAFIYIENAEDEASPNLEDRPTNYPVLLYYLERGPYAIAALNDHPVCTIQEQRNKIADMIENNRVMYKNPKTRLSLPREED